MILGVALILGVSAIHLSLCDREHKVHNIVLYPDKQSWCQKTPIKQVVASPGYESVTIDNNVCVGACYSYSIPRTQPAEPGELIGPYCDSCQPVGIRCYHVTLNADGKNLNAPKTIQKRVQIITDCSCMSCDTVQNKDCEVLDENTSELPVNLYEILHPPTTPKILESTTSKTTSEEIPELLHYRPPFNGSSLNFKLITPTTAQRFELTPKLIKTLKDIQNDEEDFDKDQIKQLFKIIDELNDKNLIEFVNFVNSHFDDFELDLIKLKDVLLDFKKDEELAEKHRNFGLGVLEQGSENNAQINRDLEKLGVSKSFGLEGHHHGLAHAKGNHVAMGLHQNDLIKNEPSPKGHHHVGETQHVGLDVGHLIKGPHGSLAFSPEEKLNLEADLIKPNQEGVVVSYENHPKASEVN